MKNIIPPARAVELAWGAGEYLSPEAIAEADIAAASHRYIEPVAGRAMVEAMAEGRYEQLRDEYAAPALAMYVRLMVQPALDIRTGQAGSVVQHSAGADPASAEARAAGLRSVRQRAGQLLRRLSERLDTAADGEFPEYDPRYNILKRCSTDGGIVQIF